MSKELLQEKINDLEQKLAHPETLGSVCEIQARVTGYYRAVQNWNTGKQLEFKDRKTYLGGHSVTQAAAVRAVA